MSFPRMATCLGVALLMGLLSASVVLLTAQSALADHCSGDKDHLADGSCGYFVQEQSSPSPSPTVPPSPIDVSVENKPTVKQDEGDSWNVTVDNFPEASPGPEGSGWQAEDRALLASIEVQAVRGREAVVLGLGLALFALGVVCVFALPEVR